VNVDWIYDGMAVWIEVEKVTTANQSKSSKSIIAWIHGKMYALAALTALTALGAHSSAILLTALGAYTHLRYYILHLEPTHTHLHCLLAM
jgi:hypothetical protein